MTPGLELREKMGLAQRYEDVREDADLERRTMVFGDMCPPHEAPSQPLVQRMVKTPQCSSSA